jgi:hypothetical protein
LNDLFKTAEEGEKLQKLWADMRNGILVNASGIVVQEGF